MRHDASDLYHVQNSVMVARRRGENCDGMDALFVVRYLANASLPCVSFLCRIQVKRGNEVNKSMGVDQQCRSVQVNGGVRNLYYFPPEVVVDREANQNDLLFVRQFVLSVARSSS